MAALAGALAAGAVVIAWPDGRGRPHAFRLVANDSGWAPFTRIVWRDGKQQPLVIDEFVDARLWSPDRKQVVLASSVGDRRLRFVDLVTRRLFWKPRVTDWPPGGCSIAPLVWSRSNGLVSSVWCGDAHGSGESALTTVDPATKRLLARRPLGLVFGRARTRRGVVLLTSPPLGPVFPRTYEREERLGPARLVRLDSDGSITQVVLRIRAGYSASRTFNREPGLAVRGDRAIIVSEGDGVAEVDLRTLRVRYHRVPLPPRRRSLAPYVAHTGTSNPSRDLVREAGWMDDRHVAVSGWDTWASKKGDQTLAAGLRILDTATWTTTLVDPTAFGASVGRGLALTTKGSDGLRAFDARGRLVRHWFTGKDVYVQHIRDGKARVTAGLPGKRQQHYLVSLATGRVRRSA